MLSLFLSVPPVSPPFSVCLCLIRFGHGFTRLLTWLCFSPACCRLINACIRTLVFPAVSARLFCELQWWLISATHCISCEFFLMLLFPCALSNCCLLCSQILQSSQPFPASRLPRSACSQSSHLLICLPQPLVSGLPPTWTLITTRHPQAQHDFIIKTHNTVHHLRVCFWVLVLMVSNH